MNELIKLFVELPTYVEIPKKNDSVSRLLNEINEEEEFDCERNLFVIPQVFDLLKLRSYLESDPAKDSLNPINKKFVIIRGDWGGDGSVFWIDMDIKTFETVIEENFNALQQRISNNDSKI